MRAEAIVITLFAALQAVFAGLKLAGLVSWRWAVVLIPLWTLLAWLAEVIFLIWKEADDLYRETVGGQE